MDTKEVEINIKPHHIFVFVLFVIFVTGIHLEFKYQLSRYIVLYDEYYQKESQIDKATVFVNIARRGISSWKAYNVNTSKISERDEALIAIAKTRPLYTNLNLSILPKGWQVHTRYFAAYINLICADATGSISCLDDMGSELEKIDELLELEMHPAERRWLNRVNLHESLKLLNAQYRALLFYNDTSSKELTSGATQALQNLGSQDELLRQQIDSDRILGNIYRLAFNDKDNSKFKATFLIPD